jgi:hypothetical protein
MCQVHGPDSVSVPACDKNGGRSYEIPFFSITGNEITAYGRRGEIHPRGLMTPSCGRPIRWNSKVSGVGLPRLRDHTKRAPPLLRGFGVLFAPATLERDPRAPLGRRTRGALFSLRLYAYGLFYLISLFISLFILLCFFLFLFRSFFSSLSLSLPSIVIGEPLSP